MRVTPLEPAASAVASTGGATTVRVLSGQLTAVPVGELLRATVARVSQGEAVLTVNGQSLTVRPSAGLQAGTAVFVRAPGGAGAGSLELVARADTPAADHTPSAPTSSQPAAANSASTRSPQTTPVAGQPQTAGATGPPAPGGGGTTAVRVLAGQLAAVPVGQLLRATVSRVSAEEAVLTVNGQTLTVRPSTGLQPGAALLVRSPSGGTTSSLELVGRSATPAAEASGSAGPTTVRPPTTASPARPPQIALVDVLSAGTNAPARAPATAAPTPTGQSPTPATTGPRPALSVDQALRAIAARAGADSPPADHPSNSTAAQPTSTGTSPARSPSAAPVNAQPQAAPSTPLPTPVRVLAGSVATLPVDQPLPATVARAGPDEAVLTVNGQSLTVRPSAGLQAGATVTVRVPTGAAPGTLELVNQANTPPTDSASTPTRGQPAPSADGPAKVTAPTTPPSPGGGGATPVRVLAGSVATLPVDQPLPATVARAGPDEAVLTVNGQSLTVRPSTGLQTGVAVTVRVPTGAAPGTLELVNRTNSSTAPPAATQSPPPAVASQPAVTAAAIRPQQPAPPGEMLRVLVDGRHEVAVATEPLTPGSRYVLQVERTPAGLVLRPPPDSPSLATDVATAVLRAAPPSDLGAAIKPLLAELAALQREQPGPVGRAAASVREAVQSFLPADDRPPNRTELQNLVENGGLHYEAKLARQAADAADGGHDDAPPPSAGHTASARPGHAGEPDLKESLLRLLQAAQEIGSAAPLAASRNTLDGVEAQQAANVAAQVQGTPYVLQIPFPDRGEWRTLNLAVEPERNGRSESGGSDGFRMLMHVPLADLGETWIDAGLSGDRLRAVLYLDNPAARDRVRAELPGLRDELMGGGFGEVLLDVRPADALPTRRRQQAAEMQAGRPAAVSILDVRA